MGNKEGKQVFPLTWILFFSFFNDSGYKDYLENACSFNRKLNEERKMRIPYIDGQTGVAQRHYDNQRHKRQRMPPDALLRAGGQHGQVLSYPRKAWKKKSYQYLKFFMQPRGGAAAAAGPGGVPGASGSLVGGARGGVYDPESEMHVISQIENPSLSSGAPGSVPGAPGGIPLGGVGMDDPSAAGAGKEDGKNSVSAIAGNSKKPRTPVLQLMLIFFLFSSSPSGASTRTRCSTTTTATTRTRTRTTTLRTTPARRRSPRAREARPRG